MAYELKITKDTGIADVRIWADIDQDGNYEEISDTTFKYGLPLKVVATVSADYTWDGWYVNNSLCSSSTTYIFTMAGDTTIQAKTTKVSVTTAQYTVNHYIESLTNKEVEHEGKWFELRLSETLTGTIGELTQAEAQKFEGYIAEDNIKDKQVEILADGSTVVDIYYAKGYSLSLGNGEGIENIYLNGKIYIVGLYTYLVPSDITFTLDADVADGYIFLHWESSNTALQPHITQKSATVTMPACDIIFTPKAIVDNPRYTVYHYQENIGVTGTLSVSNCTLVATENLEGKTGASVTPAVKSYTGFTAPSTQTVTIKGDDSTEVYYFYTRTTKTLTLTKGTGISAVSASGTGVGGNNGNYEIDYGATVTLGATVSTGYTWSKWSGTYESTTQSYSFTMPNSNVSLTANATINKFAVTLNKGTGIASVTGAGTYNYGASVTVKATVSEGYSWNGWTGTYTASTIEYSFTMPNNAVTLTANAKINSYTVTLNKGTGIASVTGAGTYEYGAKVTLGATASTGYTWSKWTGTYESTTNAYSFNMPAGNVTLTANATANTYAVKYNGNGATSGSMDNSSHTYNVEKALTANAFGRAYTVTYNANEGTVSPASATATYKFNGWGTSATATTAAYADKANVKNLATSGTFNLYALWTSTSVTLPTPTRTGYTFLGWYTAASGGTKIGNAGASYTPTAAITLYAQWDEEYIPPVIYEVTFNGNNGETVGGNTSVTIDINSGDTISSTDLPIFIRAGYDLAWPDDVYYPITENKTFEAIWTTHVYTITYYINGRLYTAEDLKTKYTIEDDTFQLAAALLDGYEFGGWYTDNITYQNQITTISKGSTGDVTLYGQITLVPKTYKIILEYEETQCIVTTEAATDLENARFNIGDKVKFTIKAKDGYLISNVLVGDYSCMPDKDDNVTVEIRNGDVRIVVKTIKVSGLTQMQMIGIYGGAAVLVLMSSCVIALIVTRKRLKRNRWQIHTEESIWGGYNTNIEVKPHNDMAQMNNMQDNTNNTSKVEEAIALAINNRDHFVQYCIKKKIDYDRDFINAALKYHAALKKLRNRKFY